MAPFLLVTKSSPPSGGGSEKEWLVRQSALWQQAVRCEAITSKAQLEMRREPCETAEQVMRREPQLGVEPTRVEKTKLENENNTYD